MNKSTIESRWDSNLVFAMSTGIEAAVVTRPEIMLAKKCSKMPSFT